MTKTTDRYSVWVHDVQNTSGAYTEVGTYATYEEAVAAYEQVDLDRERRIKSTRLDANDVAKELWHERIGEDGEPVDAEPEVMMEEQTN